MDSIRQLTNKYYSKSAYVNDNDGTGTRAVGRYGELVLMDDGIELDVWLVNKKRSAFFSSRFVTSRMTQLKNEIPIAGRIQFLDGEAWVRIPSNQMNETYWRTLGNISGIRKRKHISDEQRKKMTDRMNKLNEAKS